MRTETREVRIGEWLGPVDWSFDFHAFARKELSGQRDIDKIVESLRLVDEGLKRGECWTVYENGIESEVISVGMYDGWAFWTPRPCYLRRTWAGGEVCEWYAPVLVSLKKPSQRLVSAISGPETRTDRAADPSQT